MSEKRRDTAAVHTETAQAKCIKGHEKHKNTANMHRQWKLTVNSQNRVAMTKPRYRTQTSYILTVSLQPRCLLERSSISHFSCSTQKQGRWTVM